MTQAGDVSNGAARVDMDDVSKRVEHVTLRENARSEEMARGTRDQPYRNFERRVGARAVSDGVEAFTIL